MERAVTVMVIACPHALGPGDPARGRGLDGARRARSGLLVRNRMAFENARLIDAVIFDKTGTLTLGPLRRRATSCRSATSDRDEVLSLAGSVEELSEHPIARAIADAAPRKRRGRGLPGDPGQGRAGARRRATTIAVVSPGYLARRASTAPADVAALSSGGQDRRLRARDGALVGRDRALRRHPARVGARRSAGSRRWASSPSCSPATTRRSPSGWRGELGIERFFAEVLPAEKAATVQRIRAEGKVVAMVGDGVNDAPALATADVGIAIGAGTDVAVATADVVLVRSDPRDIPTVIALARATYRKMVQNLAWATGYNVIAIPLAAGVLAGCGILLSPRVGGLLMSASHGHRRGQREAAAPAVMIGVGRHPLGCQTPLSRPRLLLR